jgi:hypothetical protein
MINIEHEFYHRNRRALLTITRFLYGDVRRLRAVNARLCWG